MTGRPLACWSTHSTGLTINHSHSQSKMTISQGTITPMLKSLLWTLESPTQPWDVHSRISAHPVHPTFTLTEQQGHEPVPSSSKASLYIPLHPSSCLPIPPYPSLSLLIPLYLSLSLLIPPYPSLSFPILLHASPFLLIPPHFSLSLPIPLYPSQKKR